MRRTLEGSCWVSCPPALTPFRPNRNCPICGFSRVCRNRSFLCSFYLVFSYRSSKPVSFLRCVHQVLIKMCSLWDLRQNVVKFIRWMRPPPMALLTEGLQVDSWQLQKPLVGLEKQLRTSCTLLTRKTAILSLRAFLQRIPTLWYFCAPFCKESLHYGFLCPL